MSSPFKPATLTAEQASAAEVARVGLMQACPFFAHYFYSEMKEFATLDIPTAATDGRTIFYNPEYLAKLKPAEAVFVLAHEVDHVMCRDPQRLKHYLAEGSIGGKPADAKVWNIATDYVRNAMLVETGVGMMNPDWLWRDDVGGNDIPEEIYPQVYKENPPGGGAGNPNGPCPGGKTWGQGGKAPKGAKGDPTAAGQGGGFDTVLPPPVDPVTGKEDVPDESEFKEAIARAAAAAKAMGNMPGALQRMVDEILEPQVDWREHVRLLLTGHMGARHETWNRPNRRRLALNPIIITPGRRGYGADTVACVVDNSGSISEKELSAFFSEVGGVLADVRPKRVILIWCDAAVRQVDEANTLDELSNVRAKGSPGGGGTSFVPPFEYLAEKQIVPDTLIYITDGYGRFPAEKPSYPTVWCMSTDVTPPWGETVRVKI